MKIIIQIIVIALAGYLAEILLPWYSIAVVAFIVGYGLNSGWNFVGGFLGVVFLWGIKLFQITSVASTDLAGRVAAILPVKETWVLIAVTLLLGGLVGGLAATTGGLMRTKRKPAYR